MTKIKAKVELIRQMNVSKGTSYSWGKKSERSIRLVHCNAKL